MIQQSELEHAIQEVNQQLENLLERGREAAKHIEMPHNCADILTEALGQVSIALEELEVMAEELHEKNEELIANREILQLERQRYQDLFNSAPDAYFVTDNEGLILDANQTAQEILQVHPSYLPGKPLVIFVHYADRLKLNQIILHLQQQKQPLRGQKLRLSRPQANIDIAVEVTAVAMQNDQGEVVSLRWLLRDIRERQQAEAKIREQALLLENASDAIYVRDLEHKILYCNPSTEKIYGWQAAEIIGININELICKDPCQLETAMQSTLESGMWQGELEQLTKSFQEIIVESRWTLIRDAVGKPKSVLCVNTDITEKKQLQRQLFQAQRLESVGTLASGIAHDLNNILTPLTTIPQLLSQTIPNLSDSNQKLLKIMETSAKRGGDVVKQILTFARGYEGKCCIFQVHQLLNEIIKVVNSTFCKSIIIETDIPQSDSWKIYADPTQIHQLLMNLLVNARDAMPSGGTLTISMRKFVIDETYAKMHVDAQVGEYVLITIADTGVGIPEKIIDKIYDPFFTTKEVGKGTGLGLSSALGIIKTHGGFIDVSSQTGVGSIFKIYLPSYSAVLTQITAEAEKVLPAGEGELILVVDDETVICQSVKTILERHNYKVITAKDGVEAMATYVLHKNEIRVILMDIMMPYMNGAIAIQSVHKIEYHVKIIAMSGLISSKELNQGTTNILSGIQGFLYKPFTAMELLGILHQTLYSS